MSDNLPEFRRDLARELEALKESHRVAHAQLAADALSDLTEHSPVLYGNYRASHSVGVGLEKPETFLYEHPGRQGESGPYPKHVPAIEGPDLQQAASQILAGLVFGQRVVLYNSIQYASTIEWDRGLMVYENTSIAAEARAQEKARDLALTR